jgi:RNA polymerase sigma-70 factor (ECF subfamily)
LTITANLHRDELRKRKLRRLFFLQPNKNSDPEFNEPEKADSFNFDETKDESRQVDANLALKKAIASLSLKQRKVFILKEIEGLKHAEISEIMKLPVGTVKSLLHRAIKKMQYELSDFLVD